MNAEIEQALVGYLSDQLEAITPLAVHAGTSRSVPPKDRRMIIIAVRECERLGTDSPLYNAMGTLVMATPVIQGATVTQHAAMVKAARWAIYPVVDADHNQAAADAAWAAVDAAVHTATGLHCRSGWLEGPKDGHTSEDWQTTSEMKYLLTED